jgi:hypothetical protein
MSTPERRATIAELDTAQARALVAEWAPGVHGELRPCELLELRGLVTAALAAARAQGYLDGYDDGYEARRQVER